MSSSDGIGGIGRIARLLRLQALQVLSVEDALREAVEELTRSQTKVAAAERHLAQAGISATPGELIDIASLSLRSEVYDQHLRYLGALCMQRDNASELVDGRRGSVMKEHHKRDVLERLRGERSRRREQQLSDLSDKDASDLWATGRFGNVDL